MTADTAIMALCRMRGHRQPYQRRYGGCAMCTWDAMRIGAEVLMEREKAA